MDHRAHIGMAKPVSASLQGVRANDSLKQMRHPSVHVPTYAPSHLCGLKSLLLAVGHPLSRAAVATLAEPDGPSPGDLLDSSLLLLVFSGEAVWGGAHDCTATFQP